MFVFRGDSSLPLSLVHLLKALEKLHPQHSCPCNTGAWCKPASCFSSGCGKMLTFKPPFIWNTLTPSQCRHCSHISKHQKKYVRNKIITMIMKMMMMMTIIIIAFESAVVTPTAPSVGGNLTSWAQTEESQPIQLLKSNILRKGEPYRCFFGGFPFPAPSSCVGI